MSLYIKCILIKIRISVSYLLVIFLKFYDPYGDSTGFNHNFPTTDYWWSVSIRSGLGVYVVAKEERRKEDVRLCPEYFWNLKSGQPRFKLELQTDHVIVQAARIRLEFFLNK